LNGLKEAPQTRSAPSRRLQPNSGLREFGHLLTGRSWIYPTSAERGGVRGNSPCIQLVDGPPHPLASLHSRCFASAFFAPRTAAEDRLCSPRKRGEVECAASPLPHNSRSEVSGRDRLARERRGRAGERDAALLQAIDVVRRLERLHDVLLDDDEGAAFGDDRRQAGIDLAHHDGRETETDLVAEQKFR